MMRIRYRRTGSFITMGSPGLHAHADRPLLASSSRRRKCSPPDVIQLGAAPQRERPGSRERSATDSLPARPMALALLWNDDELSDKLLAYEVFLSTSELAQRIGR
jgi:hypothetical protein